MLASLAPLQHSLLSFPASWREAVRKAEAKNPWFLPEFSDYALHAIVNDFLDPEKFDGWLSSYSHSVDKPKAIGLILAGNIPMVGFHDLFCVLASGHNAVLKLSDKDDVFIPYILDEWKTFWPEISQRIRIVDKLNGMDAVIATGTNNTARYFEYYFRDYPRILRKNRNGIGVLTGMESDETIQQFLSDVFLFFGLGCRNVSKVYVPEGYDFEAWEKYMQPWTHLADHAKYRHNLDYNLAIYMINHIRHKQLGPLVIKEDDAIASRIGCLYFEYYKQPETLAEQLNPHRDEIQCIVTETEWTTWDVVRPSQSQRPLLHQYADGVDTMNFLLNL